MEPIYLAQKPYDGKPVESILKWGVGAFNIDGCRVQRAPDDVSGWSSSGSSASENVAMSGPNYARAPKPDAEGRYPANVLLSWPADTYAPRDDLTDDEQAQLAAWLDANT